MLGTQNNSFHRLLEEIDRLIERGKINDEVIVQAGYTKYESQNMKVIDFVSNDEIEKFEQLDPDQIYGIVFIEES